MLINSKTFKDNFLSAIRIILLLIFCIFLCEKCDIPFFEKPSDIDSIAANITVTDTVNIDSTKLKKKKISEMEQLMIDEGLVNIRKFDSNIIVRLKYSTVDNLSGIDLYGDYNECYLQESVAKKLANKVLGDDYDIIEVMSGEDLEFTPYEQILPFINVTKKAFFVTCDEYVTMEDGTGIAGAPVLGGVQEKCDHILFRQGWLTVEGKTHRRG